MGTLTTVSRRRKTPSLSTHHHGFFGVYRFRVVLPFTRIDICLALVTCSDLPLPADIACSNHNLVFIRTAKPNPIDAFWLHFCGVSLLDKGFPENARLRRPTQHFEQISLFDLNLLPAPKNIETAHTRAVVYRQTPRWRFFWRFVCLVENWAKLLRKLFRIRNIEQNRINSKKNQSQLTVCVQLAFTCYVWIIYITSYLFDVPPR